MQRRCKKKIGKKIRGGGGKVEAPLDKNVALGVGEEDCQQHLSTPALLRSATDLEYQRDVNEEAIHETINVVFLFNHPKQRLEG